MAQNAIIKKSTQTHTKMLERVWREGKPLVGGNVNRYNQ